MTRTFRYVIYSEIEKYEAMGWVYAGELGPPHCFYAVLMELVGGEDA